MKEVRRNAVAGGATVGVIDAVTAGLGTAVAKKQLAKGASKIWLLLLLAQSLKVLAVVSGKLQSRQSLVRSFHPQRL